MTVHLSTSFTEYVKCFLIAVWRSMSLFRQVLLFWIPNRSFTHGNVFTYKSNLFHNFSSSNISVHLHIRLGNYSTWAMTLLYKASVWHFWTAWARFESLVGNQHHNLWWQFFIVLNDWDKKRPRHFCESLLLGIM